MRPPQPQVITKVSLSALVISLPILYVSLLRLPPSTLARDTTFWFLMSNSIIVIIAADSGVLFFRPTSPASGDDSDGDPSHLASDQLAMAVEEDCRDALPVPLAVPSSVPKSMVDISHAVRGEPLQTMDGVASCRERNTDLETEDHVLALIKLEERDEDAARGPSTDMNSLVVRGGGGGGGGEEEEEDDDVAIESTTKRNHAVILNGEEEGNEVGSEPNKSLLEDGGDDELAAINYGYASAEAEPWRPPLVTSKSLVEEDEEDQWASSLSIVVARDEGRLRRSATEGSRRPAEEREYWQLSDEELNRRVEEFIAQFNREMRLQIEQEAGA